MNGELEFYVSYLFHSLQAEKDAKRKAKAKEMKKLKKAKEKAQVHTYRTILSLFFMGKIVL